MSQETTSQVEPKGIELERGRVRVVIVEDSATVRELLTGIFEAEPDIEIVGVARDGLEAVEMCDELAPDVVTMDIIMPRLDGYEATRAIMERCPTPIVIVSGHVDVREVNVSVRALQAGALTLLRKPRGPGSPDFERTARKLVFTVRAMAGVSVVRRLQRAPVAREIEVSTDRIKRRPIVQAVGMAASTGGPGALSHVLSGLPDTFSAPIFVVQHIARGFVGGLVTSLARSTDLRVEVARDGVTPQPGVVYVAPDDRHLCLAKGPVIELRSGEPIDGFRPSATPLFESLAATFGAATLAVVLTGMGRDGVAGLGAVRDAGGHVIAQDQASSVVFGMPAAALEAGVADEVRSLDEIRGIVRAVGQASPPRRRSGAERGS